MQARGGPRIELDDIPVHVRDALAAALGSPIASARNERGGFSPGLAARCSLVDGRRVFVKAVSPAQNPQACRIHRREIEVASKLPARVPAPPLLHAHDDGEWVALVFEEVDGRQPAEPWTVEHLDIVIPAVRDYHETVTPSPVDGLQTSVERHGPVFQGWRRLAAGDGEADELARWVRDRLPLLADLEASWEAAAVGETLLHTDIRADNLLIGDDGTVTLVDWPWACTGAAHIDFVLMLPSVGLSGGPDPSWVAERYHLFAEVDPDALLAAVAATTGFFVRAAQDDPPPGLPTVRAFQAAQGEIALAWLGRLLGEA